MSKYHDHFTSFPKGAIRHFKEAHPESDEFDLLTFMLACEFVSKCFQSYLEMKKKEVK